VCIDNFTSGLVAGAGGQFGTQPVWFTILHKLQECSQKQLQIQLLIDL
jgi:hypothetical protein